MYEKGFGAEKFDGAWGRYETIKLSVRQVMQPEKQFTKIKNLNNDMWGREKGETCESTYLVGNHDAFSGRNDTPYDIPINRTVLKAIPRAFLLCLAFINVTV